LGGKGISSAEFDAMLRALESPVAHENKRPVLLMTKDEWNQVCRSQMLAGKSEEAVQ
jgi:hypothetical protein